MDLSEGRRKGVRRWSTAVRSRIAKKHRWQTDLRWPTEYSAGSTHAGDLKCVSREFIAREFIARELVASEFIAREFIARAGAWQHQRDV